MDHFWIFFPCLNCVFEIKLYDCHTTLLFFLSFIRFLCKKKKFSEKRQKKNMAALINFFLQQVVKLPDKFYLVESETFEKIKAAVTAEPDLSEKLASLPMYTREEFVKQARSSIQNQAEPPPSNVNSTKRKRKTEARQQLQKKLRTSKKRRDEDVGANITTKRHRNNQSSNLPSNQSSNQPQQSKSELLFQISQGLSGAPMVTTSNISENVTFKRRDLVYLLDQLIKCRNENYLLRTRQEAYEHVLAWNFNFLTFVQAFSTLIFHNGLPISAVIFNTDMFNVPYSLFDYIERKMQRLESDMDGMYRNVVWTVNGTLTSRAPSVDEFSTFRRPETNIFLENVARIRRDYAAFAESYNQPNDFVTRGLVDIIPNEVDRANLIDELRALCTKYNMSDFSPQYLLQQSHLASLLMHFATTIYSFVPQLQVDLATETNFEFSLSKYLSRLRDFWQKQTNLSIGPFHVHYSHANVNRLTDSDVARLYHDLVSDRSDYANLSVECQQTLSQLTFNSLNRHVSLGAEIKLANTWRNLFNELVNVQDAHADLALFRKFLDFSSRADNTFNTRVLIKFDRIFSNDYLSNLVYNFREQIIILKLVIVQLVVRSSLPSNANYMSMHDPIMALKERLNI